MTLNPPNPQCLIASPFPLQKTIKKINRYLIAYLKIYSNFAEIISNETLTPIISHYIIFDKLKNI